MGKCSKEKELIITTEDKIGMLAEITSEIPTQGINITAICGYGMEGKAIFYILSNDNEKVKSIAQSKGWKTEESEVVVVELVDKAGAVKDIADKLKAKNVNLKYCYGTTCTCTTNSSAPTDCTCRLVLKSEDNDKIIEALA